MGKEQKQRINRVCLGIMACLGVMIFSGCNLQSCKDGSGSLDFSPPVLLEVQPRQGAEVVLIFNEEVHSLNGENLLESGEEVVLASNGEHGVTVTPVQKLSPGKLYKASLAIEDLSGNSCRFILPFWGWNPEVPSLLINEFNPKGSENNPDCIEFYALTGGNCGGMALYYGSSEFYDYRYVFPALEIEAGDYIILHCRREFSNEEVNEIQRKDLSGGKLACDDAWDLWLPEDRGLSGSNGVLSLYTCPGGKMQDGVVYSNRSGDPEDRYLGWTASVFDGVCQMNGAGQWLFSSDLVPPEEAVSSKYTTATRSLCRSHPPEDTNRAEDWHTVPTGKKSFGKANNNSIYAPGS